MTSLFTVEMSEPLSAFAPGFLEELLRQGYRPETAAKQLQLMAHLSRWLAARALDGSDLSAARVERFLADRRERYRHFVSAKGDRPAARLCARLERRAHGDTGRAADTERAPDRPVLGLPAEATEAVSIDRAQLRERRARVLRRSRAQAGALFFTDRLINQRDASPHTITAYRDTFRLLRPEGTPCIEGRPDGQVVLREARRWRRWLRPYLVERAGVAYSLRADSAETGRHKGR